MDGVVFVIIAAVIYFIPGFNASSRKHPSSGAIWLINVFLGWTLIGWLVALIWSASGKAGESGPSPSTHVKCPDCAELVLKEAKVCKHCGCRLVPQLT